MYGRHPRLSIDAFLDIGDDALKGKSRADYVDKLKQRLTSSYETATRQAEASAREQKWLFDLYVCNSLLTEGDRVLVRKVGVQGQQKHKDIWESRPYIVKRKIAPDIPVYEVHMEGTNKKTRTLHRNMLLPFHGLPEPNEEDVPIPKKQPAQADPSYSSSEEPLSSSDPSDDVPMYREEKRERELPSMSFLSGVPDGRAPTVTLLLMYLILAPDSLCARVSGSGNHPKDFTLTIGAPENTCFMYDLRKYI